MQFLRTVFWVVLAVVGVVFAFNNSQIVTIALWRDIVVDTPLWMVALIAFLAGLLPTLILYRATKWSLKRRLESANRALFEPAPPASGTAAATPPGAAPIVPPAGVA
jgi:lipopolysaccharide assembly protein A